MTVTVPLGLEWDWGSLTPERIGRGSAPSLGELAPVVFANGLGIDAVRVDSTREGLTRALYTNLIAVWAIVVICTRGFAAARACPQDGEENQREGDESLPWLADRSGNRILHRLPS